MSLVNKKHDVLSFGISTHIHAKYADKLSQIKAAPNSSSPTEKCILQLVYKGGFIFNVCNKKFKPHLF